MHTLLTDIEHLLVETIPPRIASLKLSQRVYAGVVPYNGSDTVVNSFGELTPTLLLPTESRRSQVIRDHGATAPHYIWVHDEYSDGTLRATLDDPRLIDKCAEWYERLYRGNGASVHAFRRAVQSACARINSLDWSHVPHVTDDFVVVPGDDSHCFCDTFGDMKASVPPERLDLFRARGFLGTEPWWQL